MMAFAEGADAAASSASTMPSASRIRRFHLTRSGFLLLRKRYHAVDVGRLDGNALRLSGDAACPGRTRYGQPWAFSIMDDGVAAAAADNQNFHLLFLRLKINALWRNISTMSATVPMEMRVICQRHHIAEQKIIQPAGRSEQRQDIPPR